ncbi:hypothetical protein HK101_004360, partial [Irineochytrium annulatum]
GGTLDRHAARMTVSADPRDVNWTTWWPLWSLLAVFGLSLGVVFALGIVGCLCGTVAYLWALVWPGLRDAEEGAGEEDVTECEPLPVYVPDLGNGGVGVGVGGVGVGGRYGTLASPVVSPPPYTESDFGGRGLEAWLEGGGEGRRDGGEEYDDGVDIDDADEVVLAEEGRIRGDEDVAGPLQSG